MWSNEVGYCFSKCHLSKDKQGLFLCNHVTVVTRVSLFAASKYRKRPGCV